MVSLTRRATGRFEWASAGNTQLRRLLASHEGTYGIDSTSFPRSHIVCPCHALSPWNANLIFAAACGKHACVELAEPTLHGAIPFRVALPSFPFAIWSWLPEQHTNLGQTPNRNRNMHHLLLLRGICLLLFAYLHSSRSRVRLGSNSTAVCNQNV
jgi:hypothetical protein